MKMYETEAVYKFLNQNRELIEDAYITSVKDLGFNTMEGNEVCVNVKVVTKEGYKNKLLGVYLNSTYLGWGEDEDETFENFVNSLLESALDC